MADEKRVTVIACTEADMAPYVLTRDASAGRVPTLDEKPHIRAIADAVRALKGLGWQEARYAPRDSSPCWFIEPESIGVHEGYRDEIGFWIYDGDTWPSDPILWRPRVESDVSK